MMNALQLGTRAVACAVALGLAFCVGSQATHAERRRTEADTLRRISAGERWLARHQVKAAARARMDAIRQERDEWRGVAIFAHAIAERAVSELRENKAARARLTPPHTL